MGFVLIELTFEGRLVLIFTFMIIFQMLSMRNGLSLHPMCFPDGLQPLQLSQMGMELSERNRFTSLNMPATLPLHQDNNPLHYASNLPNKHNLPNQPSVPYPPYIDNPETSFGLEPRIQPDTKPLQHKEGSSEVSSSSTL